MDGAWWPRSPRPWGWVGGAGDQSGLGCAQAIVSDAAWARRAMACTTYWAPQNVLFQLLTSYIAWCVRAARGPLVRARVELTDAAVQLGDGRLKETELDPAQYKRKVRHQESLVSLIAYVGEVA
jgi:hypothetical protein